MKKSDVEKAVKKASAFKSPPGKLVYCTAYREEERRQRKAEEPVNNAAMIAAGTKAKADFLASL